MSGIHNPVLATARAVSAIALTAVLLVPAILSAALLGRVPGRLRRAWHRGCCAIFGLQIRIHGTPVRQGATLYVGNHVSYLDIVALGRVLNVPFVAKREWRAGP